MPTGLGLAVKIKGENPVDKGLGAYSHSASYISRIFSRIVTLSPYSPELSKFSSVYNAIVTPGRSSRHSEIIVLYRTARTAATAIT